MFNKLLTLFVLIAWFPVHAGEVLCPEGTYLEDGQCFGQVFDQTPTGTVSEPSVLALFGCGLVGIGFARRRQS